jgi:hypothetical protein
MLTFPNPFAPLHHAATIRQVETQANETLAGIVLFLQTEVDPEAAAVFAIGHLPDASHEVTLAAALSRCEIPLSDVPEEFHALKGLLLLKLHICPNLPRLHFGDFVIVHILEFFQSDDPMIKIIREAVRARRLSLAYPGHPELRKLHNKCHNGSRDALQANSKKTAS